MLTHLVGHRTLYGADGRFIVDNINEWQHSAMYCAFLLSGVVDLVGFYAPQGTLPAGSEQVHCAHIHIFHTQKLVGEHRLWHMEAQNRYIERAATFTHKDLFRISAVHTLSAAQSWHSL
jgi:hypothetical protein